jgi:hypothetical protein
MVFVRFCFAFDGLGFLFIASELYLLNHHKYGLVLCYATNRFNFVLHESWVQKVVVLLLFLQSLNFVVFKLQWVGVATMEVFLV